MTVDFALEPQTKSAIRQPSNFLIPQRIKLSDATSSRSSELNWLKALTETGTDNPDQSIRILPDDSALEQAALQADESAFVQSARQINWSNRMAQDYVRAVRLALQVGAHGFARQLSQEGGERFPEHSEMQKLAVLLAPARVINAHLPADPRAGLDMRWLKEHGAEYRGQWVALRAGVLLFAASTAKELLARIENPKDKSILVTMVY